MSLIMPEKMCIRDSPLAAYDNGGYQVAQSLFAIGTGGWFGMGLFQGEPMSIPVSYPHLDVYKRQDVETVLKKALTNMMF